MANIKKSFNFRSGVQVDDDNLKVTPTGLVGIGTTVPIEALDVRGNAVISGVTSSVFGEVGFLTVTTLEPTQIVGAGVSIASGIITNPSMDATGIVTYFGDGRFLQGLPTSQWEDTNAGFAVSSIYNTGGTVGIATTNPQFTFQVGNNPNAGEIGVGIASDGHIKITGVVTATTFVGALTGNVTGNTDTATALQNARTIGGVSFDGTANIDLAGVNIAGNQNTTGTAAGLSGNPNINLTDLDVDGHTNLDNISVAGVTTFSDDVDFIGDPVGTALTSIQFHKGNGTNSDLDSLRLYESTKINVGAGATGGFIMRGNFNSTGASPTFNSFILASGDNFFIDGGSSTSIRIRTQLARDAIVANSDNGGSGTVELYHSAGGTATKKLETSGVGVTITNQLDTTNIVASGVITATTKLNSSLLGIGTDNPAHAIQVRKSSDAEIQITSDAGKASLTIGHEVGTADNDNAEIRFGFSSPGAPYSQDGKSLDIINYNGGNFNYHLKNISAAQYGAKATDFHWHRGINNARLMTLTGIGGSLGIGVTIPTKKLHVAGDAFISGESTFGDDATFNQALTVNGTLNATTISADITGTLNGNVNATSGISTFNKVKTTSSNNNFNGIGIKTDNNSNLPFEFYGPSGSLSTRIIISNDGVIGLGTDILHDTIDIVADTKKATFAAVGVGTTTPTAAVDMRYAGQNQTGASANRMYMYPPQVDNTQRSALVGVVSGAVIYNTSLNKLQVYVGTGAYNVANWQSCN